MTDLLLLRSSEIRLLYSTGGRIVVISLHIAPVIFGLRVRYYVALWSRVILCVVTAIA